MGAIMVEGRGNIRPDRIARVDTSAALGAAWARVSAQMGKGAFADRVGVDVKTINRAITGETLPELHTAFSSLLADPTALDEVAAQFGYAIRPIEAAAGADFAAIAALSHLAGQWVEVMADGKRDHRETLELGAAIRQLMPILSAILSEADRIKGPVA